MSIPMRRKDREISREDALALLAAGEYGILSTVGENGQPYGVPLSYILLDQCIYFHCARAGRKLQNLSFDSRVSFCVVGNVQAIYKNYNFTTLYESVLVTGHAREVTEPNEKTRALFELCCKYLQEHVGDAPASIERSLARTAVYCITVDEISGKAKR